MVDSYFNYVEPAFGTSLDLNLGKIDESEGDDALTMTNDSTFYKNSDRSLSLNITAGGGNEIPQSNGSASTTLNTTASSNTPAAAGMHPHNLASPDFNGFGNFSFDSPDRLSTAKFRAAADHESEQDGPQNEQPYNQHLQLDNYTTNTQSSSTTRNARNYNNGKLKRDRVSHSHTLSTPTAMNDFIAMLDAQSAVQEQFDNNSNANSDLSSSNDFIMTGRKERDSTSPLQNTSSSSSQFIDPNLLKSNLFVDTFTQQTSGDDFYDQTTNFNTLLDEYVTTDLLINDNANSGSINERISHMHSSHLDNDRRHSDVVTNAAPELSNNRNSISHEIDFWNLPDRRNTINGTLENSKQNTIGKVKNNFDMDNELTQVLNDYHMNFTQPSKRDSHVSTQSNSLQRHGIKKQQRSSMSVLDGSLNNDLFSKLYKNGSQSANLKVISWETPTLSDEEDEFGFKNFDPIMPSLKPITSPKSPKSISSAAKTKSKNQKFIVPSMMLSDSASTAAKVATTGSEKIDPIPQIDKRKYDLSMSNQLPLKLTKSPPPHYHTIMPSPLTSSTSSSRRRRSTPNIMTIDNSYNSNIGSMSNNNISSNNNNNNNNNNSNNNNSGNPSVAINASKGKSRSITPMSGADDDAKPFKCRECSKAFRRSEHLKRHVRSVHSTERPFACMFCDKKFSRSDNLSQHLKTHKKHGDF